MIHLKKATVSDIPQLIIIEKSVGGTKTYSAMHTKEEWLEELEKSTVYLIRRDGEIVGNTSYEMKSKDHAYLSGLTIESRFQGQGIAREALQQVLEELKDIQRIDLVTHPENAKALTLYQSFGFNVESRKENYFDDGEPRLMLVLEK